MRKMIAIGFLLVLLPLSAWAQTMEAKTVKIAEGV